MSKKLFLLCMMQVTTTCFVYVQAQHLPTQNDMLSLGALTQPDEALGKKTTYLLTPAPSDSVQVKSKNIYYHNMIGSFGISHFKPSFLSESFQNYAWTNYTAQFRWLEFGYGEGRVDGFENGLSTKIDIHDWKLGVNFPLKRLIKGSRALDVKGMLIVPSISADITQMKVWRYDETRIRGIKLAPVLSIQFPFVGIDAKLNFDIKQNKSTAVKPFSVYPEFSLKFDALMHILDPFDQYVGSYENLYVRVETSSFYSGIHQYVETDYSLVKEQYDRVAKSIGILSCLTPRFTFRSYGYAGTTRMGGLGWYYRNGALAIDTYADFGKMAFASAAKESVYEADIHPEKNRSMSLSTNVYKKNESYLAGSFNAIRVGASAGLELFELVEAMYDVSGESKDAPTKIFRFMLGVGGGYVLLGKPNYNNADALAKADSLFTANLELAPVSENHAKFSSSGGYLSIHMALELGVIQFKLEHCYYPTAYLASLTSATIGYMIPIRKIRTKLREIHDEDN